MSFSLSGLCPLTVAGVLSRASRLGPDVEAIVGPDGRLTYAELDRQVDALRGALQRAGVRHGDHVGICLGNGTTWVALFLAIGSMGAVTVPINTRLHANEIAYILRQSRVSLLFVADRVLKVDFIAMLRGLVPAIDSTLPGPELPDLRKVVVIGDDVPPAMIAWTHFMQGRGHQPPAECSPDDVLLIQYTSGTTSTPKGVVLTHRNLTANGFFAGVRMGLRIGDRLYSARPFFHVAGTSQSILCCLHQVTTLVTTLRFEAGPALATMEAERCTHFSGNDTIALMLLDQQKKAPRKLFLRGAWLAASSSIMRRVIEELAALEVVCAYGLSEASPNVSLSCWWEPQALRVSGRMPLQPGVAVRIRRQGNSGDCGLGETGEIMVRGWNVMQGYFDLPQETAAALSPDGWLATGDLGRLDADGRLEFAGRAKDLIRVGGENVSPAEIEDILLRHPDICQAQVVGVPDPRLLEVPAAFVVLRQGAIGESQAILAWCREMMAGFKVPRYLDVVPDFSMVGVTASAKLRKADLRVHALKVLKLQ